MKKIIAAIVLVFFTLCGFSKNYPSIENLDSESLFSLNLDSVEQISYDTIEANYIQICNTIKRHRGCWNKYYNIGVYEYKKYVFEILQYTNGYTTFTYLVSKANDGFPKMLLVDMRTGDQIDVSFKIRGGLIYLSYTEHCGEFPITVNEVYCLDERFSARQSYEKKFFENIDIIPE